MLRCRLHSHELANRVEKLRLGDELLVLERLEFGQRLGVRPFLFELLKRLIVQLVEAVPTERIVERPFAPLFQFVGIDLKPLSACFAKTPDQG